jgi:hypothetical protein
VFHNARPEQSLYVSNIVSGESWTCMRNVITEKTLS